VGLKYAMEAYINDFKINLVDNKINLEARVYRSQYKREKPHVAVVTITVFFSIAKPQWSTTVATCAKL